MKQQLKGGHLGASIFGSHLNSDHGGYHSDHPTVEAVSESLSGSGANQSVRSRGSHGSADVQALRKSPHRHRLSLEAIERPELLPT
jgi:hypothetical protein